MCNNAALSYDKIVKGGTKMLFGRKFGWGCCNNMQNPLPENDCGCNREIVEPTITKCIEKEFYHEVPHV